MAISEIEKLERRCAENPQGLTFAPLAEAYRKSGDASRALGVLRPGLELHPDYIPASIVLGRCHLDLADDAGAERAFAHVLALDEENVIALKALADVTERHARFDEAERWLRMLLVVDWSNEEARGQLERVVAARDTAAAAPVQVPSDETLPPAAEPEEMAPEPLDHPDRSAAASTAAAGMSAPMAADEQPTDAAVSFVDDHLTPTEPPPPLADIEHHTWVAPAADPLGVTRQGVDELVAPSGVESAGSSDALVTVERLGGLEVGEFQPPTDREPDPLAGLERADSSSDDLVPSTDGEIGVEQAEEIILRPSSAIEFQAPNAAEELGHSAHDLHGSASSEYQSASAAEELGQSLQSGGGSAYQSLGGSEFQTGSATDDLVARLSGHQPPTHAGGGDDRPAAAADHDFEQAGSIDQPAAAVAEPASVFGLAEPPPVQDRHEPELVVTETMAELYLSQGHDGEALRVYRELLGRRPGDGRLEKKVAALVAVDANRAASGPGEPAERVVPYAARDTGGQSVGDLLRSLTQARPGEVTRARRMSSAPPVPTPADALSSAPVSGQSASAPADDPASVGAPTRPAPDHLSLSAVFGDDAAPQPPAVTPSAAENGTAAASDGVSFDDFFSGPASPGASAATRARSVRGREGDDLDQFHSWLQNLKR